MVNDPQTSDVVYWNHGAKSPDGASCGAAFTVIDNGRMEKEIIPHFYKHSNFTSFIRQLNQYRFRKLDVKSWTFGHEAFVKGRPELLPQIKRKRKASARRADEKRAADAITADYTSPYGIAMKEIRARQEVLTSHVQSIGELVAQVVQQQRAMKPALAKLADEALANLSGGAAWPGGMRADAASPDDSESWGESSQPRHREAQGAARPPDSQARDSHGYLVKVEHKMGREQLHEFHQQSLQAEQGNFLEIDLLPGNRLGAKVKRELTSDDHEMSPLRQRPRSGEGSPPIAASAAGLFPQRAVAAAAAAELGENTIQLHLKLVTTDVSERLLVAVQCRSCKSSSSGRK